MLNCLILSHRFTIFHSLFSQCFFLVVSVPMPSSSWCFHRGFGSAVNSTQGIFSFQIMYFFFRTSPRSFLDLSFLPSSCSWFLLHLEHIYKTCNSHFKVPVCKITIILGPIVISLDYGLYFPPSWHGLVISAWIPTSWILFSVGYFCILLKNVGLCSSRQLRYLGSVWSFWGLLFRFYSRAYLTALLRS